MDRTINVYILTSNDLVDATKFVTKSNKIDLKYFKGHTILDAEFINLNPENGSFDKAYVFDVLVLNDQKMTQKKIKKYWKTK